MEDYDMFQLGQRILAAGNTFFEVLLKDTGCHGDVFHISHDQSDIYKLPVPPIDNEIYTLSVTFRRHNFAIILNNRDRTVTVLDTDVNEDDIVRTNIVRHYEMYGYRHKPHTCPVDKLPQQNDMFCTLWTIYMIYSACQGDDPAELMRTANRDTLREFSKYLKYIFITSGLYDLNLILQSTIINYYLNRIDMSSMEHPYNGYQRSMNKRAYLHSLERDFRIYDAVERTHNSYMYMTSLLNILTAKYDPSDDVLEQLAKSVTIADAISVIENNYEPDDAILIIFISFLLLLGNSIWMPNDLAFQTVTI